MCSPNHLMVQLEAKHERFPACYCDDIACDDTQETDHHAPL